MKKSLLIFFVLACCLVKAQDQIILKSGEVIECKIVNVDYFAIHYFPKNENLIVPKSIPKKLVAKTQTADGKVLTKNETYNIYKIEKIEKPVDPAFYFKFGVIPYQVFGRSSGGYVGFDYKKISLEYKYFYTYATNYYPPHSDNFAKFFFAGDNHQLLLTFFRKEKKSYAILAGYKSWGFSNKSVPLYDIYSVRKTSSHVQGFCFGFEYSKDLSRKKSHAEFFMDISYSHLSGSYEYYGYGIEEGIQKHSKTYDLLHLAIGFKLGGRVKLKKPEL